MAKHSLRGVFRKMHAAKPEKQAMTPQMRDLMTSFEAQYDRGNSRIAQDQQEPDRR